MSKRGKLFRRWRAEAGLLLLHTAILMGVTPSRLSSYELGEVAWPSDLAARVDELLLYPVHEGGDLLSDEG